MNIAEITVQCYLATKDSELGEFTLRLIHAKQTNKKVCDKYRIGYGLFDMTPQEELFKELFSHEKVLVKDMSILELRAHREQLAKIAFEARARLTAVDDEEKERVRAKKRAEGPTGFERSLQIDDVTSNAINNIKTRKDRLTKQDKIRQGMEKLGISDDKIAELMSAGRILDNQRLARPTNKALMSANLNQVEEPKVPVVNPFAKPEVKPEDSENKG